MKETTMSHSATSETQPRMRNYTVIIINSGYLKTYKGIFTLLHVALGTVCLGMAIGGRRCRNHMRNGWDTFSSPGHVFLLVTTMNSVASITFLLLNLFPPSTSSRKMLTTIGRTVEVLTYSVILFGWYLYIVIRYKIYLSSVKPNEGYKLLMGAADYGLLNLVLCMFHGILTNYIMTCKEP